MRVRVSLVPSAIARGLVIYVDCSAGVSASLLAAMQMLLSAIDEGRFDRAKRFVEGFGAILFLRTLPISSTDIISAGMVIALFKSFFPRGSVVVKADDYVENAVYLKPNDIVAIDGAPTIYVYANTADRCVDGYRCNTLAIETRDSSDLKRYVDMCREEMSKCSNRVVVLPRDAESAKRVIDAIRSMGIEIVCEPQLLIDLRQDGSFRVVELGCNPVAVRY